MIDIAIRTRLLAVAGVTVIVGTGGQARIYPLKLPQNPRFPAITYQLVSGSPEYQQSGAAGVAGARIQIDCWAQAGVNVDPHSKARTLGEAVRAALSAFTGTVGTDVIQSCFLAQRRMLYEDAGDLYRESQDWLVGYTEA